MPDRCKKVYYWSEGSPLVTAVCSIQVDIWSLGCILAELLSSFVLLQASRPLFLLLAIPVSGHIFPGRGTADMTYETVAALSGGPAAECWHVQSWAEQRVDSSVRDSGGEGGGGCQESPRIMRGSQHNIAV